MCNITRWQPCKSVFSFPFDSNKEYNDGTGNRHVKVGSQIGHVQYIRFECTWKFCWQSTPSNMFLAEKQLDAPLLIDLFILFFNSLHVSGTMCPSSERQNCINTASVIVNPY
jgi:hypothetical protein